MAARITASIRSPSRVCALWSRVMAAFPRTRRLRALRRAEQGSVAVELALYIPVMLVLLAGLFQFGSGIFESLRLESAARAGAQYAMIDPTNSTNIQNAVLDAIGGDT